ncbi:MAG: class I SAM-dependent methyltransferase [Chloracidobacterium sp.]|uniref:Methyltransferase domain-containing protein n=1 Tax=Chloracidobacterium validum TaxID=2821543 RepID=A0ABX8BF24_9BACT|nr:class I SAM-dependent methyltransferase [Chloracidobacterium validum]QUW03675.1 methyltransferase domain-containing protein [Chloracidobacterium validum]
MERILEPEVMDTPEEAQDYDAMDFTEVNTAFAEGVVALGIQAGRLLDVGTGTARIPILIAGRLPEVRIIAVDLSAEMLKLAAHNVALAGLSAQIELRLTDAKALPFPDASFDVVISNSIIHHIPQPEHALREIARVAKPEAALFIRDLLRPATPEAADALVAQYAAGESLRQQKLFRDSLGAALTLAEIQAAAREAGLTGITVTQTSDRHWTLIRPPRH